MSIQDERDLRGRLGGLLDSIEPVPAPISRAMQRGKVIRMRRWVAAAAGVAVIAAGSVVLPRLIDGHRSVAPIAPRHYKVTVQDLGLSAKGGVIGAGTINHKLWKIVLDNSYGGGCATQPYLLTCGWKYMAKVGPRDVSIGGASEGRTQFQYGTVGSDVTSVVIRLSNGSELSLRPVSAAGHRWVAVAAPVGAMIEAASFVGASEYQYAVPYIASDYSEFVTWLRPGQPGLPRDTRQVGSGKIDGVAWHDTVAAGPWGYCVLFVGGSACTPAATRLQPPRIGKPLLRLSCSRPLDSQRQIAASTGVVAVPAGVKNVVLRLADGSHMRLVAVPAGGLRLIGYAVPSRPKVVRALEYGFAGQLVGSISGASWGC